MGEAVSRAAVLADEFGEITMEMLRATFDHWRIFEKDGRWWGEAGQAHTLPARCPAQTVVGRASIQAAAIVRRRLPAGHPGCSFCPGR